MMELSLVFHDLAVFISCVFGVPSGTPNTQVKFSFQFGVINEIYFVVSDGV